MINKKEKKITNVELLDSINRSFSKMEEKMATKEDLKELKMELKLDIEGVKNKIEGIDKRIDDFVKTKVSYENLKPLIKRVEVF